MFFRRHKKHRRQSHRLPPCVALESLEPRSLLSASLRGGVLTINGGSGNDQIVLSLNVPDANRLVVTENGRARSFDLAAITSIKANGGRGNDLIELDQGNGSIQIPTTLIGGVGNDTLIGGGGADRLEGGVGNDLLRGQAGNDSILGGVGDDNIDAGNGDDTVQGDAGDDTLTGSAGDDSITGGLGDDLFSADDAATEIQDAGNGSDEIELTLDQVPTVINDAVVGVLGDGTLTRLTQEFEGTETSYQVEFESGKQTHSVRFSDAGDVIEETIEVDPVSLPVAVTNALQLRYRRGVIEGADFVKTDATNCFEVALKVGNVRREVTLTTAGVIKSDVVQPPVSAPAVPVKYSDFTTTGQAPFFNLEIGRVSTYEGVKPTGEHSKQVITVLDAVKMINGVETRIVEERHTVDDVLVEVSRNYFAIDRQTGNVYYFGEDVDDYAENGQINHPGQWRDGVNGAKFGLLVPGNPVLGLSFLQERAPGVALDSIEIVSTNETVVTPYGTFTGCVKFRETTPLEPTSLSIKYYAPGFGLVSDGGDLLTSVGRL